MENTREKLTLSVAEAAQLLGLSLPKVLCAYAPSGLPRVPDRKSNVGKPPPAGKWVDREAGGAGAYEQ